MLTALAKAFPGNDVEIQRLEMVGPKVGDDLTNKALGALYYATLLIAVYISGRFEQRWMAGVAMAAVLWGGMYLAGLTGLSMGWLVLVALGITLVVCFVLKLNFALGALVGLIHDVFITVGLLSLMSVEIDLNVMAALLTLVGYSLNDTIIVYDRLREHLRAAPKQPLDALINRSVNQTLSRTILTSGTTFMATLALYLLGGGVIHDFALTMLIGVFVGTASSIYVSSAVLLALGDTEFYVHQQERPVYEKPGEHGIVYLLQPHRMVIHGREGRWSCPAFFVRFRLPEPAPARARPDCTRRPCRTGPGRLEAAPGRREGPRQAAVPRLARVERRGIFFV